MNMNAAPAIFYFHTRSLPKYLLNALESARIFNPRSRIFLVTDQQRRDLSHLGVETRVTGDLESPLLRQFRDSYVTVSNNKVETLCYERWFFLEELRARENIASALCIDSDYMLFSDVSELFAHAPAGADLSVDCSACVFINTSLESLLNFILEKFRDGPFIEEWRHRYLAADAAGQMDNLTDMNFFEWALDRNAPRGTIANQFPRVLPCGYLDECLLGASQIVETRPDRRHNGRKRVFWSDRDGAIRPYFRALRDGGDVPALGIHFQNGAKRVMFRFNRIEGRSDRLRALRLRYYNHRMN